ncbi:hypothetical protein QBZ16_005270 [Prototheca wickerhamii]|uniref:RRM domain-containing protein n=1 Tax=Prototheca wickerhamii TaxID=3111 RepID=A0AAD9MHM2_PROWI|nr:hypothetical protein QBZ16_005270 [Prototheca wickerhamii]
MPSPSRSRSPRSSGSRSASSSRSRSASPPPKKDAVARVHVGHLTRNVTEAHVREVFACFGKVLDVDFALDREVGLPRGFAYVKYATLAEAESACDHMDGGQLDGQTLAVRVVTGEPDSPPRRDRGARSPPRGGRRGSRSPPPRRSPSPRGRGGVPGRAPAARSEPAGAARALAPGAAVPQTVTFSGIPQAVAFSWLP